MAQLVNKTLIKSGTPEKGGIVNLEKETDEIEKESTEQLVDNWKDLYQKIRQQNYDGYGDVNLYEGWEPSSLSEADSETAELAEICRKMNQIDQKRFEIGPEIINYLNRQPIEVFSKLELIDPKILSKMIESLDLLYQKNELNLKQQDCCLPNGELTRRAKGRIETRLYNMQLKLSQLNRREYQYTQGIQRGLRDPKKEEEISDLRERRSRVINIVNELQEKLGLIEK